jgi:opacity protein-like surface antigen
MQPTKLRAVGAAFLLTLVPAFAGQPVKEPVPEQYSAFSRGSTELQIGVGALWSWTSGSEIHPNLNDAGGVIRYGWMLTDVADGGWFTGNWELLLEAHVSGIYDGPGDILAGGALLLRYNFVNGDSPWVPYFQIGAGGTYSDAEEDPVQTLLGAEWSFNLQASLGVRYMFSDRCAAFAEFIYRHLSNADLADRNTGVNSTGAYVGVSLFF